MKHHPAASAMDAAAPLLPPRPYAWPIFGWEYHIACLTYSKLETWDATLNRLGLEGWKLISTLHDESTDPKKYGAILTFMRPRPEVPSDEELRELGFKHPKDFTTWQEDARRAYARLVEAATASASGPAALDEGRIVVGRDDEDEDDDDDDLDDEE